MAKKLRLTVLFSALMAVFILTAAQAFAAEITSIDYIRADGTKEFVVNEYDGYHGYYRVDSDRKDYFYYTVALEPGDKLILNSSDGTSSTYVLSQFGTRFVNEDNKSDVIDKDEVTLKAVVKQTTNHWLGGNTYELDIEYNEMTLPEDQRLKYIINDRTMDSIEAQAREKLEIHDGLNESEFTKSSWYTYTQECNNLKKILDDKDHTEVALVKQMDKELDQAFVALKYIVDYYLPVDPANDPVINYGETVETKVDLTHRTKTIKFDCTEDAYYTFFTTAKRGVGRILEYDASAGKYRVVPSIESSDENYYVSYKFGGKKGTTYYLQIGISLESKELPFTVWLEKDSTMKRIEYILRNGKTIEFEQYVDAEYENNRYIYKYGDFMGNEQNDHQNDQIKCTYVDGTVKIYTYDEYRAFFVNDDDYDDILRPEFDDGHQYVDDEWYAGKHSLCLLFEEKSNDAKYTVEVPVTIKPCSITGFSYVPASTFEIKEGNGSEYNDVYGNPYYYYMTPTERPGDKLIVTKNGTKYTYVYIDDLEVSGKCGFYCEETGEELAWQHLRFSDDQVEDHWLPNKDNYFTVEYYRFKCNVPVTIISDGSAELDEAKQAAQALLDKVSVVDQSKYTSATYGPFAAAKEALEDLLEDSTADAGKIYAAIDVLQNAFDNLKTVEEEQAEEEKNQAISNARIAAAQAANIKAQDYTLESFAPFKAALDKLNELLADTDLATTAELNDAVAKLEAAKEKLVKSEPEPHVVVPVANTLKVTPSKKTYKLKVKSLKKKAYSAKPFKITGAQGKVTYKATASGKSKKYLSFKSGKLKVKKGTKKGKYVITVKVTAAGNENYLPLTKSCKITVTVK